MRKTQQQKIAKEAWDFVNAAKNKKNNFEEYKQLLQGSGSMILSVGLGQTVAFYYSQGKSHYNEILKNWYTFLGLKSNEELIESLMSNSSDYRYKTTQILSLLEWMKRFSKGLG